MTSKKGKRPLILGLTGGVGAGKSTILTYLKEGYGFQIIQADQIAKELMEPGKEGFCALADTLGSGILTPEGAIDRDVLARLLFSREEIRRQVDEIIHPLAWNACFQKALSAPDRPSVIEAAILSKEFRDNCHEMWYVYTSRENREKRLMASRGYSPERCRQMMESQASEEEFRAFADAVIDNNGTEAQTRSQIDALAAAWGSSEQEG